ncbi:MAG TPA: ABC transporter ATP-binding protein [Thermoanaerobaculia bacterium]|nr:ABC transporter ATP-binding protein [Thermoanaerobaculia bacterium]
MNETQSPASVAPPVAVDQLTVRYGKATACAGVSLSVPRGSVYALLGRNGAGKSSLVRCLLGQQRPTEGRALLFGNDSWTTRTLAMVSLGVVPEEPDAPPAMTVSQIADFCSGLYASWDAAEVSKRLDRFGIPRSTAFGRLSKGQKAQVMLTLALGHSPEVLVLDDPTLGLDVVARRALYEEVVGDLADRGTTVFLTTHDLSGVEGIATHVGILKEGELVLDEELESLKLRFRRIRYGNERSETRTAYGTELDFFDAVRVRARGWGVDAVVSNYDDRSFATFRQQDGVRDAEASSLSLEEIFVAVAGEEKGETS